MLWFTTYQACLVLPNLTPRKGKDPENEVGFQRRYFGSTTSGQTYYAKAYQKSIRGINVGLYDRPAMHAKCYSFITLCNHCMSIMQRATHVKQEAE